MPANLAAGLTADYKVIDGTEAVTFTSVNTSGNTSVSVSKADPHEVTSREIAASDGYFQQGDLRWTIWRTLLSGTVPKPGDKITRTSDSVVWHVLDVVLDDLDLAYDLVTRKAR